MTRQGLKGKAQTVLGVVDGGNLGITLPHEHLFIDLGCYALEPKDPEER
jgi:predicted metal-dependent phosphotriesterase family hydrolase